MYTALSLELQTVSTLERCPAFIETFHCMVCMDENAIHPTHLYMYLLILCE